ncbi:TerB family tellurite resistance protein [Streptomyces sp. NPDC127068]|uniref:TerB family tellurite resistance protein n=1 Tax=Streptomyces sp. NPDC127068 TaxID=3347127 RepID=UPI0036682161
MTGTAAHTGPATGKWLFKQDWAFNTAPDFGDVRVYAKALLVVARGDGVISPEERDWVLGYIAALTGSDAQLQQELADYAADDDVVALVETASAVTLHSRTPLIFDALRACDADGDLAPGEIEQIKRMASALGITEEAVDRLKEFYFEEKAARVARIAAVFPQGTPYF